MRTLSNEDSQQTKLEGRTRILVKLSFIENCAIQSFLAHIFSVSLSYIIQWN